MSETSEVVIVGGGAASCALAYYLAIAGVRATIVEREGVGTQASGWATLATPSIRWQLVSIMRFIRVVPFLPAFLISNLGAHKKPAMFDRDDSTDTPEPCKLGIRARLDEPVQ